MREDIRACIQRYAARIDHQLKSLLPAREDDFLSEAIWHHLGTGGKRIRPALCLLTCEAFGGEIEKAVPFAAAIEVLHNMLLIHDDLADGDTMRRDRPTVWYKYGMPNAVNVGDYLLGQAYRSVLMSPVSAETKLRLLDAFNFTYLRTVEGQALDINSRAAPGFTVEAYLRMAELKTGYYLSCGMVGGAIVANAPEQAIESLWGLGRNMGPAFQIRDDVIDLTVGKGRGGVVGSDIREGKASILYAYALQRAASSDRERLIQIMARPRESTSDEDVAWVMELYKATGAIEEANKTAESLIAQAQLVLEHIPAPHRDSMKEILSFMTERMS